MEARLRGRVVGLRGHPPDREAQTMKPVACLGVDIAFETPISLLRPWISAELTTNSGFVPLQLFWSGRSLEQPARRKTRWLHIPESQPWLQVL